VLGGNPKPDLLHEKVVWEFRAPKRLSLNFISSSLAAALCHGDVTNCQPTGANVVILDDVPCDGDECLVYEVRTLQAAPGMWFEYIKPPCVNQAFYSNPQTLRRRSRWRGGYMCGNPKALEGAVTCCDDRDWGDWRKEIFGGERVPLSAAIERCEEVPGRYVCKDPYAPDADCGDPSQGGCDSANIFYWTQEPCELTLKINPEGRIAVIHKHGVSSRSQTETMRMLKRYVQNQ
jgi:hypothetical protein